jgi:hypothetical protein
VAVRLTLPSGSIPAAAGQWTWIVSILLLAGLLLPARPQFWLNLALLAAAGGLLGALLSERRQAGRSGPAERAALALSAGFAGWILLDFALHGLRSSRPLEWLAILAGLALFWAGRLAARPASDPWPGRFLLALAGLVAVEGAGGLLQGLWPALFMPAARGLDTRACGTFTNPNQYAGWLAAALPAVLFLAFPGRGRSDPWRRVLGAAALAAGLAGLAFSGSRGAAAGLFAGLLAAGLILAAARRRILAAILAGLVLLAFAGTAFRIAWSYHRAQAHAPAGRAAAPPAEPLARRSFAQTLGALGDEARLLTDPAIRDRLAAFFACAWMWRDHPWLGVGPGNFTRHARKYLPGTQDRVFFETGAHCLPLQLLAELGVIGGLFWPAAAAALAIALYRRFRRAGPGSVAARAAFCLGWGALAAWSHNWLDITAVYHPLKYVLPFIAALAVAWPSADEAAPQADSPQSREDAE